MILMVPFKSEAGPGGFQLQLLNNRFVSVDTSSDSEGSGLTSAFRRPVFGSFEKSPIPGHIAGKL